MEQDQTERTSEQQHLRDTLAVARAQWDAIASRSAKRAEEIQAAQEEMLERLTYDKGGLYSAQGFQDLLELTQVGDPVAGEARAQKSDDETMRTLARTMKTPYFARIDFRRDDEPTARAIYIGRATLMEPDTLVFHVYDWRTPIASVFYRFGTGPASYDAPAGTITGEVSLKRQYEIRDGELIFFFDADVQIVDEFLRDLLSRPATAAMKSIVETIQRDQDMVIRDLKTDLLMVQGAAGSGKTSVALHRIAYLMYQGLQDKRLSADDILILSPNAVFERYIARVLPELGEKQVRTVLFEDIFQRLLPDVAIQPRGEWVEAWLSCRDEAEKDAMRRARAFKGSRAFTALLDRLVRELPRRWIPFADADYIGTRVAWGNRMRAAICNSKKRAPLATQLTWLEREIFDRVHALRPARMEKLLAFTAGLPQHQYEMPEYARMLSIRESARLLRHVRAFTRVDCLAIYRAVFADPEAFARLSRGLLPPDEAEMIRRQTLDSLSGETLPYGDAAAVAYLNARVHGLRDFAHTRQLVLDEAQDADALHIALLGLLFPWARFTILGDVHQTVAGTAELSLYDDIKDILRRPNHLLVRMEKSFRCTREIWAYSAAFLPPGEAGECFSRSGAPPRVLGAPDEGALDDLMVQEALDAQAQGCLSVALLCKTSRDARALYERLKGRLSLRLVEDDGALDTQGIFVTSLYVAKGLEFDAVLVCGADAARYRDREDAKLLYIACTRALHRLSVCYAGQVSPLLPVDGEGM